MTTRLNPHDSCPSCNEKIVLKPVGESLLAFELDGTVHKCTREYEPRPIGQAIKGKVIEGFELKRRVASIILSDNHILEISASVGNDLVAMNLRLLSPEGIVEEKR